MRARASPWASTRANAVIAVLGALSILACNPAASALFSDDEARQALNEQSKQLVKLQNEKQALEARVLKLEEALRNQGLLDLLTQVDALNAEISALRGQSEVHGNSIDAAQKRQKDFYVDLDSRLRRLEQQAGASGSAPPASAPADAPAGPAPEKDAAPENPPSGASSSGNGAASNDTRSANAGNSATSPSPSPSSTPPSPANSAPAAKSPAKLAAANPGAASEAGAYDAAYNLFKRRDYAGAISGFQNFLQLYPASPLAPNAQYWIGNAQFAQRDFAAAIASQKKLLASYPGSKKGADAMLNIANAQSETGETAAAKKTLQDVIERYPSSEASEKARRRLSLLK